MNVMDDLVSAGYSVGSLLIVSSVLGVFSTGIVSPGLRRPVGLISAAGIVVGAAIVIFAFVIDRVLSSARGDILT